MWSEFLIGGYKLVLGITIVNATAGGITYAIAKNRSRNQQMMVFLIVIFLMGGIVHALQ